MKHTSPDTVQNFPTTGFGSFSSPTAAEVVPFHKVFCPLARQWRKIVLFVALSGVLGFLASFLVAPRHYAEALVRIEPEVSTSGERTTISAEAEIISARSMISEAVEKLGYSAEVNIKSAPIFWRFRAFLADLAQALGIKAAETGTFSNRPTLRLGYFVVDPKHYNETFLLRIKDGKDYELISPKGEVLQRANIAAEGAGERPVLDEGKIAVIHVQEALAPEGTVFSIVPRAPEQFVSRIQSSLGVRRTGTWGESGLLALRFSSDFSPKFAEYILQELLNVYVADARDRSSRGRLGTLQELEKQLQQLAENSRTATEALTTFRLEHNISDISTESQLLLEDMTKLEEELVDYQTKIQELNFSHGKEHPEIKILQEKIRTTKLQIADLEERLNQMPKLEQEYTRLERQQRYYDKIYERTMEYYAEVRPTVENITGYARVISSARVEPLSYLRWTFMFVVFAAALGGVLIASWIIIVNLPLFVRLSTPEQLLEVSDIPVIAVIPRVGNGINSTSKRIAYMLRHPGEEAYKSLQTIVDRWSHLTYRARNKAVAVAGIDENHGATFTATALASMHMRKGHRVILVDAEIAPTPNGIIPAQHTRHTQGLTDILVGNATLDECLVRYGGDQAFDYLPAGTLVNNYRLLSNHDTFSQLLKRLDTEYECVIINMPSLGHKVSVRDYQAIAGTVLLVARCGTRVETVEARTRDVAADAPIYYVVNDHRLKTSVKI